MTKKPRFLDFFCGSGLVSEGVRECFETVWANDICPKKAEVYTANHPTHNFVLQDITKIDGADVPCADISWASFPCVDLSLAGNMAGIDAERSGLVWQWLRIMDEMPIKPPQLVIENVAGLISSDKGSHYSQLHDALTKRNYTVGPLVINADRWLPQSRVRVFIVAVSNRVAVDQFVQPSRGWAHPRVLEDLKRRHPDLVYWRLPQPVNDVKKFQDILELSSPCDDDNALRRNLDLIPKSHFCRLSESAGETVAVTGYKRSRQGKQVLELRFDGIAGCLRTPKGGSSRQYVVIKENKKFKTRLITTREAARLMGAPENFKLPENYNDGYYAMGDAVALPVVKHLATHLLAPLSKEIAQGFGPAKTKSTSDNRYRAVSAEL
jgi:DNA (cytosine-5)-methyltransferase 1